ncbi:PPSD-like protein [Mya arenaria]|uniref:PPSD-like protein n=1 Tax=Mya arenaria TaxID=6604 RepID=A0ABY7DKS5_MYAAR|nr:PPSD-like protein [Mya arenaria]
MNNADIIYFDLYRLEKMMDDEEAIAVVGVGCRFPGADTAEEFWRVLVNSENHVKDIPKDRWNNEAFFNEDKDAVGKSYVSKAGLLKDHDMWDNKLFGVSDVEAARIDPQQRYVLECVHMAMEDGGFTRAKMSGTKTGVYIGCMNDDYKIMSSQDPSGTTNYSATGTSTTVISARVSYVFNLHGPCLTVDTACSSAMMAIHLGCQAIRSGDCCQAICGGVSSIMYPDMFIPLSKARMMSTVGRCQTFCDTADGYARGEGCGVVILKPLKQALRDSDKVWGVIVTGTNQDGRASQPMTAPSGNQQQALLKHVYTKYDIDPSTVQYIEAHGTGTHIGDPTETNALGSFFSKFRGQKPNPLLIGSVKTNIGHTESAAGVAGLIKVLLMMKEGKFVPSLHIQRDKKNVNKEIDLGKHNIDIPVEVSEWKVNVKGQRIACINSFGFGGSNCHAVVKSAAKLENYEFNEVLIPLLFGISGIDKNSLQNNLVSFIKNISEKKVNLPAASYTSLLRRDHFKYRTIIAGSTIVEVKNNARVKLTMTPKTRKYTNNNIVFVFSGVGTTWPGMCCQFMTNQTFRKTIKEIDDCLQPLTDLILSGLFTSQETKYDDPFLNHVAIFAVQVALARVWIGFDVEPNAIIGQSVGEVAAAHISGRIPLAEAVRIIVHRSKILAEHIGGSMMVVKGVNLKRVELICSEHSNTSIAVYSSPVGCTLSGESSEIESIKETLQEHSETEALNTVLIRKLNVASAYHSPLVDCCKKEITDAIGKIEHINNFKYKIISTVTANDASDTDFTTGEYWAKNVRKSVLLYQSVKRAASNTKYNIFLEIGPKPVLKAHLPDIFEDREFSCQQSMNLNKELPCMFDTLSELFQNGVEINWTNLFDEKMIPTSIPKYVFQKSKTLHLSEKIKHHLAGLKPDENTSHMFIKSVLHGKESEFEICLSVSTTNFVFDHRMSGTVLVPGATYIDAALFVGTNVLGKSVHSLSVSVEFVNPVILQQNEESSIVVSTDIEKGTVAHFRCRNKTGFVVAKGKVFPRQTIETKQVHIQELKNKCRKEKDKGSVYSTLRDLQFEYGPSLAMIEHSWCSGAECISEIFIPDSIASEIQKTIIHPAIVDAMFQTFSNFIDEKPDVVLPKGCETITLFGQIDPEERTLYVYVKLISQTANEFHFNLVLLNPTGIVLLEILDFYAHTLEKSINVKQTYVDQKMAVEISRKTQQRQVILFSTKSLVHETWFSEFVGLHRMCCIEDIDTEHENRLKAAATLFYSKQPVQTHDSISASAVNECLRFREFLCLYHKNDLKCPIYIITENTQDHLNKAKACVTVEGSYLWGMIRALRHEQDHLDLRLEYNRHRCLFRKRVQQSPGVYSNDIPNTYTRDSNIHHKVDSLGLFRKSGCYIVVGGLTGLGRLLVKYIAELGAGQIAIFSRRQPDDEQKSNLKDFETRFSTTIRTFQVDVTELSSINLARERLCVALKGIPIRGVFQGAGVLADGLYETQTAETFMKVLKPKLDGTWNLHLCFQDLHLDYFVMHSSVTSLLGNRGQTNYAAANSFLDSMALYRRSLGMSGQAINWGALAIGMAEDDKIANRLQHQGIGILSEERTKTYFTDALLSNVPNICFADLKWDVLSRSSAVKKQKNKFSGLFRSGMAETEKGQQQKENINLHELQGLAIQAKRSDVRNIILTLIGKQFIIDIITLKDNQNFVELGIDSLSAVGFVNDLRTVFSVPYPLVNLISGTTTIGTVVDFYCECSKKAETKINNHTENDLEESKRQAAVTQIPELIGYFRSNVDPGLTYMTDIEIKGMTLTHADFRSFVVHVLTRFRELRCHIKHDGLETFVVTEDDANDVSDKIPIEIFPFKEMVEKFNTAQDQRGTVTFDLENQYPIKFQIGETNSCLCIRVCVHKAVSDMTSIVLIFKEMKTFFESSLRNKQNNAHVHEVYPRKAINEAVRERRKDGLKYWRQRIAFASPCSLAKPMSEPQANFFKSTSKALGPNIYNQIMEFLRDSDATLFQLFASVYQLLLSVETGQPNVTILTDVNLRAEIPAIAGEVVRGINVIPLSVQPSKQMTFKEFLGENKKQILADIEHGSFPYLDIVNILQPEIKANIGRHYLIMNDMTQFDILTGGPQDQSYTISIKNFWIAKMSKETICQVEYNTNTKNITIHFHYNELICGAESGRNLGERLFQILHHGINNGQQTIEALFHKEARSKYIGRLQHHEPLDTCIHEMATEISTLASPNNYRLYPSLPQKKKNLHTLEIMNGYFQKQTKAGWSHRVYVTLLEHQDNDNDAKWMTIQWSKKPGRPTKSLSVSNCDSICMLKLNGQHSIVVQTPERQLVIHTPDHEVANRWMTVFENSSFIPSIVNAKND